MVRDWNREPEERSMTNISTFRAQDEAAGAPKWVVQRSCPSCQGEARPVGTLFMQAFNFGQRPVPGAPETIRLMRCDACSLIFKSVIAAPALLEELTQQSQGSLWHGEYDYADEIAAVTAVDPEACKDVIDVGAAAGGFLASLPGAQRTSALDIVRFDTLQINGEFIHGFLDDETLEWSGQPYGLIGLFDVAEHLYNPTRAFSHLRTLARPGGLVIIETGDSDTVPEGALSRWYYLNLMEHHMAWNRASLEALVARTGFEIVSFRRKFHKTSKPLPLKNRAKVMAYAIAPELLRAAYRMMGKTLDVPASHASDHMQVILRAV